jgi:pyridoxal phosphate enzyme (YggS family)
LKGRAVPESADQPLLRDNLAAVEERLAAACRHAGRARSEVTLVAVTKSVGAEMAGLLPGLGIQDLGESRPQELSRKAALLPTDVRWHLIGHLQRNKIERTLPLVCFIHSVDSVRLLEALEKEAGKLGKSIPVLLEVNVSGETSKQGFEPAHLPSLPPVIQALRYVQVKGLMTMAALQTPEACRPTFVQLRALRDRLRAELDAPHVLEHLSMGMSNDFEVAVEEGATFVRLGSVLFEGLSRSVP